MKKISYSSGTSEIPLLGLTIGDKFDSIVDTYPDNEALVVVHQDIRWTYKLFGEAVTTCARALLACGIEKGDRVGIWSPNCAEWAVLQFATAKAGIILVNINPSYRKHELSYVLNQSGCKMLVLAAEFKSSNYVKMLTDVAPDLLMTTFGKLDSDVLPDLKMAVLLGAQSRGGLSSWESFMELSSEVDASALAERQASLTFDDPINIQYTSGTTGQPKGATLSHHNILNNGYFVARSMQFSDEDRLVIPVPLYHCFGMVMGNIGCVTHGATMIYPSEGFEPGSVLEAAANEKATAIYGVPTMFIAQLDHPDFERYDLTHLRTGIMAGSLCPTEVMKKVQSLMHMKDVQIAYGMTETSPVSTQTRMGASLEKQVSTVGQVHPHLEVKIINEKTGQLVPRGVAGELCTRGYSVMLGYWNDREKTEEAIDAARWMHTGDIATMDDEGYISISGRIKDMIIRGGENVYPKEIEEYLYSHHKISDVQVIGIPSQKYGEEVMAWVKLKEGATVTDTELREYCKDEIAHYKIPKYFKITDDFPMTVTGKIRKVEMRQIAIEELNIEN